jgi:hypothetical protein
MGNVIKWTDSQATEIANLLLERLEKDPSKFDVQPANGDPHKLEKAVDSTSPVRIEFNSWGTFHFRITIGDVLGIHERDYSKTPSEATQLMMKLRDSFESILKAKVTAEDMEKIGNDVIFKAFPEIGDKLLK